jgi:hypothetical protein
LNRPSNCKYLSWNDAHDVEKTSPVASVVHPSLLLRLPQQQQQQQETREDPATISSSEGRGGGKSIVVREEYWTHVG